MKIKLAVIGGGSVADGEFLGFEGGVIELEIPDRAAEAVADAILVSSGFANGEGSLIVRLRPEVLGGSEVWLVAKDGALTVFVNAATQDVQEMVETNRTRFEQHLAEKVHTWHISVAVKRGGRSDERV